MKLVVNGKPHEHGGDGKLLSLLAELGADPKRVAVAVNDDVVRRSDMAVKILSQGDRVEILTLAGGG